MIEFRNVSFSYPSDGTEPVNVLDNVSFSIEDGSFAGIVGEIGGGKTTLCKLMSGLLKPSSGQIGISGRVSLAMQFPESQLFESTVMKDVMFGPVNLGLPEKEAVEVARRSLNLLGFDESFFDRNPLRLSGGEKRRVALAGVLAMDADVLVLDEPCVGLDPKWKENLYALLRKLNGEGRTIVVVSHDIDGLADNCRTLLCLENGGVFDYGKTEEMIHRHPDLETRVMRFAKRLKEKGVDIDFKKAVTGRDLADLIAASRSPR